MWLCTTTRRPKRSSRSAREAGPERAKQALALQPLQLAPDLAQARAPVRAFVGRGRAAKFSRCVRNFSGHRRGYRWRATRARPGIVALNRYLLPLPAPTLGRKLDLRCWSKLGAHIRPDPRNDPRHDPRHDLGGKNGTQAMSEDTQVDAIAQATADGSADLAMIRKVLMGDRAAAEVLVRRVACLPLVLRLHNRRRGAPLSPDDLEDVLQEALLAMWRKLSLFDGRCPLERWALGFAVTQFHKGLERRARRLERVQALAEPDHERANVVEAQIDGERLAAAVGRLEEQDAQILRLKHFQGLTFEEISSHTGLLSNTVKTRYYRSLRKLKELIGTWETTNERR